MINTVRAGDLLRLPSGNVVMVIARLKGGEWACVYTEHSRARGEVVFTAAFLQSYGRRA